MSIVYATKSEVIAHQIIPAIEAGDEVASDFDVNAIAAEVITSTPTGYTITMGADEFWQVVERHARGALRQPQPGDMFVTASTRKYTDTDGSRKVHKVTTLARVTTTAHTGFDWERVAVIDEQDAPSGFDPFRADHGSMAWFGYIAAVERGDVQPLASPHTPECVAAGHADSVCTGVCILAAL